MKIKLFFIIALMSNVHFAQAILPGINKIWYFGNLAGIDFNGQTPVALLNGATNTYDNVATISDEQGSLAFYCDGENIWNKDHALMVNGNGILGSLTGGQPALIIKQPDNGKGNNYNYYVFTVAEFGTGGLHYSIVDMSLDSGRGEVVSKNNLIYLSSCEKLAAVYNQSDDSYWIITHEFGNSNFNCYKVNSTGLNINPVVSNVGDANTGGSFGSRHGAMGQLAISENGTRIANAMNYSDQIQLFNFDIATGLISSPITIINRNNSWGVAFSPDGNMLYATDWQSANIYQYSLLNYNPTDINASEINLGAITNPHGSYKAGYLKLAPDGKIYIAKYSSNYLATINNPDAIGLACDLVDNGINLGTGISTAGLSTSVVIPNSITGIDKLAAGNSFVFPNPATSNFKIQTDFLLSQHSIIRITNIQSSEIKVSKNIDKTNVTVEIPNSESGLYFYEIIEGNKSTKGKIIIQ